ncbi:class I SAM-dependent methyltransferase [Curtobacterium sp. MCLR17_036]|uniref:class I SAM-dependent methyltransferase n=1 Tax=Curtobacterium sp. MCLR17_036 TaxID=2175620 RepID=UPI000DA98953|nr:class I SAM-dependent methyltransferase [Curtobacterium sp. MCLR17_036]WIE65709.1 class I SAM-dependent methyltransferase [Curtobacterium sp. MCLR17_036]
MGTDVTAAYAARASEYAEHLGSMDRVHADDRQHVTAWADGAGERILDAGCGPGHWSAHLADRGHAVLGIDAVPWFVDHAQRVHGGAGAHGGSAAFRVGSVDALDLQDRTVDGVLAWYSLIHHAPDRLAVPLAEIRRVLRPGGSLLVGFFEGPTVEPFDHAVVGAHRWSVPAMVEVLVDQGFDVHDTRTRTDDGQRPHAAVTAATRG